MLWCHLKKLSTFIFLGIVTFNGMAVAPEYSFSFLFLDEINASNLLVGMSMVANGACGALGFMFAQPLIKRLGGSVNAMAFRLGSLFVRRFFSYSLIFREGDFLPVRIFMVHIFSYRQLGCLAFSLRFWPHFGLFSFKTAYFC